MIGTRGMGTVLGENVVKVYQPRNGRRIFTGTYDPDLRLYQWAPSRDGGSIRTCSYIGRMAFGEDEWETILSLGAKHLEFKDPSTGYLYFCKVKKARLYGDLEETPNGLRFLVPLEAFRVVRDSDRAVMKEAELR